MRKNTFPVIQYYLLILLTFYFHQLPFKPTKMPKVSIFQICHQGGCPLPIVPLISVLSVLAWLTSHRTQIENCFSRSAEVFAFSHPYFPFWWHLWPRTKIYQAADKPVGCGPACKQRAFPTSDTASCPRQRISLRFGNPVPTKVMGLNTPSSLHLCSKGWTPCLIGV